MTRFAVTIDRVIAAPRAMVYRAWLDPVVLARWMGPDHFAATLATVDERVGGVHVVDMIDTAGEPHTFSSVIEELVPDERIVLTFRFHPDGEDTTLRITLRDAADGGTALRLEHERLPYTQPLDDASVNTGWSQTLAKLQALLEHT
ncbi:MAG: ATPase [Ilumatobacteraceae bacterium]|nr:ATPase [Ilumatobacteraceae bacterium]